MDLQQYECRMSASCVGGVATVCTWRCDCAHTAMRGAVVWQVVGCREYVWAPPRREGVGLIPNLPERNLPMFQKKSWQTPSPSPWAWRGRGRAGVDGQNCAECSLSASGQKCYTRTYTRAAPQPATRTLALDSRLASWSRPRRGAPAHRGGAQPWTVATSSELVGHSLGRHGLGAC